MSDRSLRLSNAVIAVSEPEKKADSPIKQSSATRSNQIFPRRGVNEGAAEEEVGVSNTDLINAIESSIPFLGLLKKYRNRGRHSSTHW
jgi:hypothetical protein